MIVTIDGPAGSGKSTVASKLANKLGFIHLNSGALFRSVALRANELGVDLSDDEKVAALASKMKFEFCRVPCAVATSCQEVNLFVDGCSVQHKIKTEKAGELASRVGMLPEVRKILLNVQRQQAEGNSLVLEGRDAGTHVFPMAEVKIYLDASAEVRAKRRWLQLQSKGVEFSDTVEDIKRDILLRDERELTRKHAPLRQAEGAIFIDTSDLSIDEVVSKIYNLVKQKDGLSAN